MKKIENITNRQIIAEKDMINYKGGFIMPTLIARAIYRTMEVIEKAVDWLTTNHKE